MHKTKKTRNELYVHFIVDAITLNTNCFEIFAAVSFGHKHLSCISYAGILKTILMAHRSKQNSQYCQKYRRIHHLYLY